MFNIIYLFDIFKLNSLCGDLIFIFVQTCGFLQCEYFTWETICDFVFLMCKNLFNKIIIFAK